MTVLAPNVSWLLKDKPVAERLRLVAQAGFEAIEIGFYGQFDLQELMIAKKECGLSIVLINMDVPGWGPGRRGYMADPSDRDAFRSALDEALHIAGMLEAQKLMVPVGASIPAIPPGDQEASVIENLSLAASMAEQAGILLTIEPLSPAFASDYFLTSSAQALEILRTVGHPHVKLQFDTYHLQMTEGNLINTLRANIQMVGHIQFADVPGRTEPGHGELNFANIAKAAEDGGYRSYIGLEYIPLSEGAATFDWIPASWRGSGVRGVRSRGDRM